MVFLQSLLATLQILNIVILLFFWIFNWRFPCSLYLLPLVLSVPRSDRGYTVAQHILGFRFFCLPLWSYEFVGAYFCILFLPWTSKCFNETKSNLHPVKWIWLFPLCKHAMVNPWHTYWYWVMNIGNTHFSRNYFSHLLL